VQLGRTVPVGLIASDWGGQPIEVFSSPDALSDSTCGGTVPPAPPSVRTAVRLRAEVTQLAAVAYNHSGGRDGAETGFADDDVGGVGESTPHVSDSQLWFGMLAPFVRMRFTGVIWYQGEDNCWAPHEYACRFPAMISDWRAKFELPQLSFFFVQLAPYWPRRDFTAVRNAQMAALKLPLTGYAVAIDLGAPAAPDAAVTVCAPFFVWECLGVSGSDLHHARVQSDLETSRVRR
jgi:sialate O-acetylesterase